jgi:formamidopyrimidine-DNA glycosylase
VPEILEVESYRRLAEGVVGQRITRGWSDALAAKKLPSPSSWARAVRGLTVTGTSRRGKLLLLETDGATLGIRFGMTGVLLIDGVAGIEGLFYGPHEYRARWVRGGLDFADGRRLVLHDPRRLGRFEIEPTVAAMGPDALTLTRREFDIAMLAPRPPGPAVKARLMDQTAIAGMGNLLADEALFRAGLDPRTPVGTMTGPQRDRLYRALRTTLRTLTRRGGSHTGDHMEARFPAAICPRDGGSMLSATIGGRTTYWCSLHQHA